MPKSPTPAQQLEFSRLHAFLIVALDAVVAHTLADSDAHPARVSERMWDISPADALRGLRAATADIVEMTQDLDGTALAPLERRLMKAGAPSLDSMRDRRNRQVFRILQRGHIRNDDEWRLLNSVISDVANRLLIPPWHETATTILAHYERRRDAG